MNLHPDFVFDHLGVPTTVSRPGELFVAATKVWVTNPRKHPFNVEFLRFEDDSEVTGPLRDKHHTAYRVSNLSDALSGHEILAEPFRPAERFATVAFIMYDGEVIEFMEFDDPENTEWFG
ncbi:hypothetical protein NHL51_13630 [Leucobacter sp. gxy201]|uniref:hypothetical protein n=1 Tax=Leucobacter sp. gxy201 TaxID=2957200 RepID=UPI003DA19713